MAIDLKNSNLTKKIPNKEEQKIKDYFYQKDGFINTEMKNENPQDAFLTDYLKNAIMRWRAPEFEKSAWEKKWYLIATLILSVIILYALFSNNPIVAITFILIGVVGYLYLQKEPRILDFAISGSGIIAGDEIYEFSEIKSFWIFYEPYIKVVSLRLKNKLVSHVHIPIHNQNPVKIREVLLQYIPEKEQELRMIDIIEKVFRI